MRRMGLHEIIDAYEAGTMSVEDAIEHSGLPSVEEIYETETDIRTILSWAARASTGNDNRHS
jgi:hypothetical protein